MAIQIPSSHSSGAALPGEAEQVQHEIKKKERHQ